MLARSIKIAVFYRDLPEQIEAIPYQDPKIAIVKDGLYELDGAKHPRLTISFEYDNSNEDKPRLKKLVDLLTNLRDHGLIVAFKVGKIKK